jgi:hypothetical protein
MMRNRPGHITTIGLLAAALLASPAHAQASGARACDATIVYSDSSFTLNGDAVERMHPLVSRARYAKLVEEQQWTLAVAGLRDDALQAFAAAALPASYQGRFNGQLDQVLALLRRMPPEGDTKRGPFVNDSLRTNRFAPELDADNRFHVFGFEDTLYVDRLAPKQQEALCWSALSVDQVLWRISQPLEASAIARLGRLTGSWANYRTYGYTRQPLELLLFRGKATDSLPRPTQWLVAHLSLGADIRSFSADSLLSNTVSVVELIGILKYRKDYTQYHGVSAIVTLGADHPIGYGAMVHFARSMRAGALYRPGEDQRKWSVVTSTDLYGMLEHSKKSVEQGLAIARGLVVLPKPGKK